jgi:antirestriction protein ArdC
MSKAYEAIFSQVIARMEAGVIPWQKPWNNAPANGKTGKAYRGINSLVLGMSAYQSNRWVTFKQAQDLGGSVKKGEKATTVVFWNFGKEEDAKTGKDKSFAWLKTYSVFNAEQTEGCDFPEVAVVENADASIIVAQSGMADIIVHGGNVACYIPSKDTVKMPPMTAFTSPDAYYATLFHELGHATGAETRLKRPGIVNIDGFGGEAYSQEELVAEFTSAFLCQACGLNSTRQIDQTAAYLQNWMQALRNDPAMLVKASGQAQKAADYIRGIVAEVIED